MRLLLDTHAFLWWVADDERLPAPARAAIADPEASVLVSAASAWEIAIKVGLGKLRLASPPPEFIPRQLERNSLRPLPVALEHALGVHDLPHHHADPFDRLLIAQARIEDLTIVSGDAALRAYDVPVTW